MKPCVGLAESGSATSALIPHTIVVLPILTSAEPCAVDIEPVGMLVYVRPLLFRSVDCRGVCDTPSACAKQRC